MALLGTLVTLSSFLSVTDGKKAFVIVDTQECFLENGSLPVVASQIIPKLNEIRTLTKEGLPFRFGGANPRLAPFGTSPLAQPMVWQRRRPMLSSQVTCNPPLEYCPPDGFYNSASNPMLNGNAACTTCKNTPENCFSMTMDLWLDHCLQGGDSTFAGSLIKKDTDITVQKGHRYVEMFSAFMDNTRNYKSALDQTLKNAGITEVYAAGIATTHCVRWTVQDAIFLGYNASIIMHASAGIWGTPTSYADSAEAIADFQRQGITGGCPGHGMPSG